MTKWKLAAHKIGKPSEVIEDVVDAPERPSHDTAASLLLKQVPSGLAPPGTRPTEMLYACGFDRVRVEPLPDGEAPT